jgi:hypothetical protein
VLWAIFDRFLCELEWLPSLILHMRLVPSETQCLLENISLGRTDALSAHRLFRTVLSLSQPFNTGYHVEYPFFAQFLAIAPKPIVGIVIIRARHSAKIRAKSLIVSEKTIVITAHLCSETAVFAQIPAFRLQRLI